MIPPVSVRMRRWLPWVAAALGIGVAAGFLLAWLLPRGVVESEPSGAVVLIDGRDVGRTPLSLTNWLPATWQVRVEAPGHAPWSGTARVAFGETTQLVAVLAPLPGSLAIETEPGDARVAVDGTDVGTAPLTLTGVPAGRHHILISAPDHESSEQHVHVAPGVRLSHYIVLRPLPALLTFLTSASDATVFVDDRARGPASEELALEPGERQVRVEAAGYRPWRRTVYLLPNETRVLEVAMQPAWPDLENGDSLHPIGVIIENQADARPQSGLDSADVVYEALAEGGITRFLAVYATREPEVVGPVRSARHYFVHWAKEYEAPLVHIGASSEGYAALSADSATSVDAMRGRGIFWRTRERAAPHNAYTSIAATRVLLGETASKPGSFGGLLFRNGDSQLPGRSAPNALVSYGPWKYGVTWSHDPYANDYVREMDGHPHLDAVSGQEIRASNVLVEWVPTWAIPGDTEGRLDLAQVGSGSLLAFVDGVAVEGKWSKPSAGAPTTYLDADGKPLRLNPGPTWIHVLPMTGRVDW